MKVSIVIPCYNEKATIEKIVEAVRAAPIQSKEIIIVDDGSRDGTQTVLNEISNTIDQVIYHPANRGKGAALRSGFAPDFRSGDFLLRTHVRRRQEDRLARRLPSAVRHHQVWLPAMNASKNAHNTDKLTAF